MKGRGYRVWQHQPTAIMARPIAELGMSNLEGSRGRVVYLVHLDLLSHTNAIFSNLTDIHSCTLKNIFQLFPFLQVLPSRIPFH
jgi:hypothetical protein